MKVIYISGPFRDKTAWGVIKNIYEAAKVSLAVWKLGAVAHCPHLNTGPFQGELPDAVWLEGHKESILHCDAVLMTGDWPTSEGSTKEFLWARQHEIPVFHSLAALEDWLKIPPVL